MHGYAELDAAILAAPDDPASYLVLADQLQIHGDPRGELIVLQHRGDDDAANELIAKHGQHLLGRFAAARPETFELVWRFGFIREATIGWESFGGEDEDDPSHAQLSEFLALPSARYLEKLALGPTPHEDEMLLDELAASIEQAAPPNLRSLYLGDTASWDISGTSTRMPRSATLPRLRTLGLRGGSVTLDDAIDLPELREFSVETGSLSQAAIKAIASANWPHLERLDIWFGDPHYGARGGIEDIAPILAGRGLGALRKLGLCNCAFADEVAAALVDSKVLAQLERLDLSMGNLSDRGVATMLANTARFSHLAELDLTDNALTNAHWPAARTLAKSVAFGSDHSPERAVPRTAADRYHRYVSVGE